VTPQPGQGQAAQATPPPRIDPALLRPRRFWFGLAGAVAIAGIGGAIALFIGLLGDLDMLTGGLTRLETPGQRTLQLDAGSKRTVYQQVRGVSGPIDTPSGAIVACAVKRVPSGESVEVDDTGGFTFERGRERYVSVLKFEVNPSGNYRVRCEDRAHPDRRIPLAIGRTIELLGFIGRIFATLGAFFGGIIIAAGIATPVAVMRSTHKDRLVREAQATE
jgi:hypothetical protein